MSYNPLAIIPYRPAPTFQIEAEPEANGNLLGIPKEIWAEEILKFNLADLNSLTLSKTLKLHPVVDRVVSEQNGYQCIVQEYDNNRYVTVPMVQESTYRELISTVYRIALTCKTFYSLTQESRAYLKANLSIFKPAKEKEGRDLKPAKKEKDPFDYLKRESKLNLTIEALFSESKKREWKEFHLPEIRTPMHLDFLLPQRMALEPIEFKFDLKKFEIPKFDLKEFEIPKIKLSDRLQVLLEEFEEKEEKSESQEEPKPEGAPKPEEKSNESRCVIL